MEQTGKKENREQGLQLVGGVTVNDQLPHDAIFCQLLLPGESEETINLVSGELL